MYKIDKKEKAEDTTYNKKEKDLAHTAGEDRWLNITWNYKPTGWTVKGRPMRCWEEDFEASTHNEMPNLWRQKEAVVLQPTCMIHH